MKKNRAMRTAAGLGIATLLTMSVISGSFAKYTTSKEGTDSARVAKWGFMQEASIGLNDLFSNVYKTDENGTVQASTKVIAPGTEEKSDFSFTYGGADTDKNNDTVDKPEVKYTFTVSTEGSSIGEEIKNNTNIKWALDGDNNTREWGNWETLLSKIKALSGGENGTQTYEAGNLPSNFASANANNHTVYWKWIFEDNNDTKDTEMGNASKLEEVKLNITITATQVD